MINENFNFDKNKALEVFYLVNKMRKPNDIKESYNLIYLIQRESLKQYHHFIYNEEFKCLDYNIKPLYLENQLINDNNNEEIINRPYPKYLSVADKKIIKKVLKEFSYTDRYKIWELINNLPEISIYSECNILEKDILIGLGYSEKEADNISFVIEEEKNIFKTINNI